MPRKPLNALIISPVGEKLIKTIKYLNDLVLLVKNEDTLQDMIDRLVQIERKCGMEVNIDKTKDMRISRKDKRLKIIVGIKSYKTLIS